MKNDYEMYQSVLSKRNEYRRKKERRMCIIKRTVPVLACLCLILGLSYWIHIGNKPIVPPAPDIVGIPTTETTTSEVTESISTAPITSSAKATQTQAVTSSTAAVTINTASVDNNCITAVSTQKITAQAIHTAVTARPPSTETASSVTTKKNENVQTLSTVQSTAISTTAVTGGDMGFIAMGSDNGYDFHVTTRTNGTVSSTTAATSTNKVSTTSTTTDRPSGDPTTEVPINEQYGLGIMDGYDGWYINAFRISPDNVGEYIGIIVMRSPKLPFLDAKAYKIKKTETNIAIAVKFEGYDGYYLYRSNETTKEMINEMFSAEEELLNERVFFMSKTKKIIAAATAAIITSASTSLMSVYADNHDVSDRDKVYNSSLVLDKDIVYTDQMLSKYIKDNNIRAYTALKQGREKIQVIAENFDDLEPVKAYVKEAGLDESLIEYGVDTFELTDSPNSSKGYSFNDIFAMTTEEVQALFNEKGLTVDNGYHVYGQGNDAEYVYCFSWDVHLFSEDYLSDKTVEEILTDYPPHQSGGCLYDKGESLWDTDRIVSALALPEEYFEVTVFKKRVIVKGEDSTDKYKISCDCGIRCKLPEGQERASVRNAALNYLQLREDFDELVIDDAVPYYGKEKTTAQKYGEAIAEYMAKNSIQGVVSRSVPDEKLSIGFHGDYEDQVRAYIAEIGLNESGIPYELEKLPDFIGFDNNTSLSASKLKGDANCDGQVDMSDIVLVMQALANPNKYGENGTAENHLTAQGKKNADIDGDGLTVGDAQSIQQLLLGVSDAADVKTKAADVKYEKSVDWLWNTAKSGFCSECSGNGFSTVICDTNELKKYLDKFCKEEAVSEYLEKYNESFFSENVLFLDFINQPAGLEVGYKVDSVELSDDVISVTVTNTINGGEDIITLCLAQVCIPKKEYKGQNVEWNVKYVNTEAPSGVDLC
ncbi:hypothetical protein [Ruminococcus flavefaciens]|uniref:Dockerin domain-containing protein n=1 Tax=Ruminococcus flavefaciens TaxID=1265 RepID=A0A1M7K6K7_RUMFL|nr:hypothetical protein [Ruminococcus flavefaciens]SHM60888.1 hypothetical protein SAMN04487860_107144 [Ruminococcus flavefaciens]